MFVVLDSSTIIEENFGNSSNTDLLLSSSGSLGYVICIPSLVLEEVNNHFRQRLQSHVDKMKSSAERISGLIDQDAHSIYTDIDIEQELEAHSRRFAADVIKVGGQFLQYPPTSLQSLVERAVLRRRPFDKNGAGFRDALIWDSVLQIASKHGEQVVLIAKDGDFSEGDNLHPHLIDDLNKNSIETDNVVLFRKLSEFIAEYVRPHLKEVVLDDPLKCLCELGYDLKTVIPIQIQQYYAGNEWGSEELNVPSEYETIHLSGVEDFTVLKVRSPQRKLEQDNKLLLSMYVELNCLFDVFVYKPDWYLIEEEDTDLEVWDFDWSRHYVWAVVQLKLHCELELVVDMSGSGNSGIAVEIIDWKRVPEY